MNLKKQTLNERRLKEELMKRRIEIGVHQNVGGVKQEIKALIYHEDQFKGVKKFRNPMEMNVQLRDMNEEEDRDREILNQYMKKYAKIWKFLFGRYANQAYSGKNKNADFESLEKFYQQISQAEINKMLRDHNTFP